MKQTATLLREQCLALFQAGICAADPASAVKSYLQHNAAESCIPETDGKVHIVAFGKAACAMAQAAREAIPANRIAEPGIIVTTYDSATPTEGFEVLAASHPLPDTNGLVAAQALANKVQQAKAGDRILALISGGGSALLPYPVDGIGLDDKIATTQLLLSCGANINQINCVRKHLSRLKGGGLAKFAAPTPLHALILSDVIDDDLSAIASGPSVADDTTFADAIAVCQSKGVWEQVPDTVKAYLRQGAAGLKPETPKSGDSIFHRVSQVLIGSNSHSVDAMANAAAQRSYQTRIFSRRLTGEARQVAEQLVQQAANAFEQGIQQPVAVIAGGETTVTLTGGGKGGRNQEMALAFALAAERQGLAGRWTFMSGGTDGRDGPTDAAGGLVDSQTLDKVRAAGIDPEAALDNNDSYTALKAANALVITGPTGTNVADLQILLLHPFSE